MFLIQFSVENYRSIKQEQTLSMVRDNGTEMPSNFFDSLALATPELVKSAVIYGANASGKSNLIKALGVLSRIIAHSFNKSPSEKDPIPTESFILNSTTRSQPTVFDISFVIPLLNEQGKLQASRVDYGFVVDKQKVYEEWLSVYPKGREQNWFHREYDDGEKEYQWKISSSLKGEKESWKKQTRSDQLFLSTAVHLNSEQLNPIYQALTKKIQIIRTDRIENKLSKNICKEKDENKKVIISFLQAAGIDVDDILFKRPNVRMQGLPDDLPNEIKEKIFMELGERLASNYETIFVHKDENGLPVEINLNDESDGTQKIFEFSGLILSVLNQGNVLVVDELNKSLHPDLVRFLVKLFNSEQNKKNAQLIFTTHETSVLRKDLLRRDQVWFCEKQGDLSTQLYPLTDFKPHISREDIEEYYLHGRYGAKPIFKSFDFPEYFLEINNGAA